MITNNLNYGKKIDNLINKHKHDNICTYIILNTPKFCLNGLTKMQNIPLDYRKLVIKIEKDSCFMPSQYLYSIIDEHTKKQEYPSVIQHMADYLYEHIKPTKYYLFLICTYSKEWFINNILKQKDRKLLLDKFSFRVRYIEYEDL